jgi:ureidoacrylate peracid hydrolase
VTSVSIAARPEPFAIDLDHSAVIVIDMQNDFGAAGGMFDRAGIDITPIRRLVPRIAGLLDDARAAGLPIVYTKQQHRPDLADAGGPGAPHFIKHQRMQLGKPVQAPDGSASRILVEGTWNTDIVPELAPQPGDIVVGKHRFSAFFETELDARLRDVSAKHLIFVGATTSICVESTVRDAMFRDYHCLVLADCTAEPIALDAPRSNHEASLLTIELLFGWVGNSLDFRPALRARVGAQPVTG